MKEEQTVHNPNRYLEIFSSMSERCIPSSPKSMDFSRKD